MDQTINEMVYKARITNAVNSWNEHVDGKKSNEGTVIARNGDAYKIVDGKLVMASPDKKAVKFLNKKLAEYGLYQPVEEKVASEEVAHNTTEMVAGM